MTLKEAKLIVKSKHPRAVCRYNTYEPLPFRIHSYRCGDPVGPYANSSYWAWIEAALQESKSDE
jgi:hypothetical protein